MIDQFETNYCTISYRLLKLLQWLAQHEQEAVKKLITKALQHGLDTHIHGPLHAKGDLEQELQDSVVDFFGILETLLNEVLNEDEVRQTMQRELIPALDHIDSSICDTATVASSVAKATAVHENNSQEHVRQVLFKELLKRWKPAKKPYAH